MDDHQVSTVQKYAERIHTVIDFCQNNAGLLRINGPSSFDKYVQKIIGVFNNKTPANILYCLYNTEVSTPYEMGRNLRLGYEKFVKEKIRDLEQLYLVNRVDEDHPSFKLFYEFWRRKYPTSPSLKDGFPEWYVLNEHFHPVVEAYILPFIDYHVPHMVQQIISQRGDEFRRYKHLLEKRGVFDEESNILTRCIECNAAINVNAQKGIDFHVFSAGHVCRRCYELASDFRKWIRRQK